MSGGEAAEEGEQLSHHCVEKDEALVSIRSPDEVLVQTGDAGVAIHQERAGLG